MPRSDSTAWRKLPKLNSKCPDTSFFPSFEQGYLHTCMTKVHFPSIAGVLLNKNYLISMSHRVLASAGRFVCHDDGAGRSGPGSQVAMARGAPVGGVAGRPGGLSDSGSITTPGQWSDESESTQPPDDGTSGVIYQVQRSGGSWIVECYYKL